MMMERENKARDFIAVVFLTAVCGLAIWQGLEILAIFALVGIGAVVFKQWTKDFLNELKGLVEKSQTTKIGSVELKTHKEDYSTKLSAHPAWMQIVVSKLDANQIGLLIAVHISGRHPATETLKPDFRALRSLGLLEHDEPYMAVSKEVWLSPSGKELAAGLVEINSISGLDSISFEST